MALGPRTLLVRTRESGRRGKLLLALIPVFLVLVGIQAPRVLDAVGGTDAPGETGAVESAATEPTASEPAPSGSGTASPAATYAELPDTDPPTPADIDKLASLDRFTAKDSFVQQVSSEADAPADETTPSETDTGATSEPPPPSDESGSGEPVTGDEAAQVSVNGDVESVLTGRAFPSDDPIFRLEGVTPTTVTVALVSGSFSGGRESVTLQIGQTATLVNQTSGRRYRITFVSGG